MHLFAPERLAASFGIVGSSGPAAAGFALASQALRPGTAADVLVSDNQAGLSFDPGALANSAAYYWQIVATDEHGLSNYGPIGASPRRSRHW